MIVPTNGRVVWFYPGGKSAFDAGVQPHSAQVAYVHNVRLVNLGALQSNGVAYSATSVQLLQDDDAMPEGPFAMWMPYQQGQAAKTEAAEAKVYKGSEPGPTGRPPGWGG